MPDRKIHIVERLYKPDIPGVAHFDPEKEKGHYTVAQCGKPVKFNPVNVTWMDERICGTCFKEHLYPQGYVNSYVFAVLEGEDDA